MLHCRWKDANLIILESRKMQAKTKEYDLVIVYCAFMVAILLARHVVTSENVNNQWSAEKLAASLNTLPYSNTPIYMCMPWH